MQYPQWLSPFVFNPNIPILGNLRWYGVMYLIGIFVWFVTMRHFIKRGDLKMPIDDNGGLYDLALYITLGIILGGRFGFFILYSPLTFIEAPWEIFGFIMQGQTVFNYMFFISLFGGLLFLLLGGPGALKEARIDSNKKKYASVLIGILIILASLFIIAAINIFPAGGVEMTGLMGMAFHGGITGVIVGLLLFCKKYNFTFLQLSDYIVVPAAWGLFFGRLGNFVNAELWGRRTSSWIGMRFPRYPEAGGYRAWKHLYARWMDTVKESGSEITNELLYPPHLFTAPRHPSQLYEAFLEGFVLFWLVFFVWKLTKNNTRLKPGIPTFTMIGGYGLFRFCIEFVREPDQWRLGWLTAGMAYSLPMFLISITVILMIIVSSQKTNTVLPKV